MLRTDYLLNPLRVLKINAFTNPAFHTGRYILKAFSLLVDFPNCAHPSFIKLMVNFFSLNPAKNNVFLTEIFVALR